MFEKISANIQGVHCPRFEYVKVGMTTLKQKIVVLSEECASKLQRVVQLLGDIYKSYSGIHNKTVLKFWNEVIVIDRDGTIEKLPEISQRVNELAGRTFGITHRKIVALQRFIESVKLKYPNDKKVDTTVSDVKEIIPQEVIDALMNIPEKACELLSSYIQKSGESSENIHEMVLALLNHPTVIESSELRTKLIDLFQKVLIDDHAQLNAKLAAIRNRGALEEVHTGAAKAHGAYTAVVRNLDHPPEFTHPNVLAKSTKTGSGAEYDKEMWADPEDAKSIGIEGQDPRVGKDLIYGKPVVERMTYVPNAQGEKRITIGEDGRPVNPREKTGLTGRGLLGKFGPNHAADPEVFYTDPETGITNILVIERRDKQGWALPGGMVDPGEKASATARREFEEEAGNIPLENVRPFMIALSNWIAVQWVNKLEATVGASNIWAYLQQTGHRISGPKDVAALFDRLLALSEEELQVEIKKADVAKELKEVYSKQFVGIVLGEERARFVYEGYVDDPRNTDNVWMETAAYAYEVSPEEMEIIKLCKSGDDAMNMKFVDATQDVKLYASHTALVAMALVTAKPQVVFNSTNAHVVANHFAQVVRARQLLVG